MAKTERPLDICIVDDEIHYVEWLLEYLEFKGYRTHTAENVFEGRQILESSVARCAVIDLNIPLGDVDPNLVKSDGLIYLKYPGLFLASIARNMGYRGRQVVIYSVHRDPEVASEVQRLGCTYVLKGQPKEMKAEMEDTLQYDPTEDNQH